MERGEPLAGPRQYLQITLVEEPEVVLSYDGDSAGSRAIWRYLQRTSPRPLNERSAADWELEAQREHWLRTLVSSQDQSLNALANEWLRRIGAELARREGLKYARSATPYNWTGAIASVKARADLLGIFGSRRPDTTYGRAIRTSGNVTHIRCPFHLDNSPSLAVYDDHWYCYGCGDGGDAIDAVQKLDDVGFCQAVEALAAEYGIQLPRPEPGLAPGHRVIR